MSVVALGQDVVGIFDPSHTRAAHKICCNLTENMKSNLGLPPPAPKLASFAAVEAASLQFPGPVLGLSFFGDGVQHSHGIQELAYEPPTQMVLSTVPDPAQIIARDATLSIAMPNADFMYSNPFRPILKSLHPKYTGMTWLQLTS